ncbi:hypothetical protein [Photobacterium rosenbergii]|uniref:hypothetical protein n=1 Tax=Photobacterium rosenbergii TaxID=294936 RepID=UPI001C99E809|nr:hypothetical protein [Photobacterium rosenbergii]MBY5948453.1 hypothetical protein [Photobacterium rosenbergii]
MMKRVDFFIVIALLCAAFWAGQATNDTTLKHWEVVKDLLQVSASILTFYVAYKALNTWKEQHVHIERYKAVVGIERAAHELLIVFRRYVNAASHERRVVVDGENSPNLLSISCKAPALNEELSNRFAALYDSITWAETFISNEDLTKVKGIWTEIVGELNSHTGCHQALLDTGNGSQNDNLEKHFWYKKQIEAIEWRIEDKVNQLKRFLQMIRSG